MNGKYKLIASLYILGYETLSRCVICICWPIVKLSRDFIPARYERKFLNEIKNHQRLRARNCSYNHTLIAAWPISTPLKLTGKEIPTVSSEILEGLWSVVVKGTLMYSLALFPPLPTTLTSLSTAVPPNELIPARTVSQGSFFVKAEGPDLASATK